MRYVYMTPFQNLAAGACVAHEKKDAIWPYMVTRQLQLILKGGERVVIGIQNKDGIERAMKKLMEPGDIL